MKMLKPRDFELAPKSEIRNEGLDLMFRSRDGATVAVLIFGPYQNEQAYKQRRAEFVQRLLGLGLLHSQIIAAIPPREHDELKKILYNYGVVVGAHSQDAGELLRNTLTFYLR